MANPILYPSQWLSYAPGGRQAPICAFERFVGQRDYPCVGAKSALGRRQITYHLARDIRSGWDDLPLAEKLQGFARSYEQDSRLFQSFVAIFGGPRSLGELDFERALWTRLQSIHDKDSWLGYRWDPAVSSDPADEGFSFSIGGRAFFVVGLHPRASRKARRFAYPTLVFNLHDQFEQLRAEGRFGKLRKTIQHRDIQWSGGLNPMLADHGAITEARQYSGRRTGDDWRCPFHPNRESMTR